MAVIPYDFQVLNSSGIPQTGIAFSVTGIASPGLAVLIKKPSTVGGATTAITPSAAVVSFVELGQGNYTLLFDAEAQSADCFAVVDAGTALSGANRYIPVALNRDSSRLVAGVVIASSEHTAIQGDVGTGLTTQNFPATLGTRLQSAIPNAAAGAVGGLPVAPNVANSVLIDSGNIIVDGTVSLAKMWRGQLAIDNGVYSATWPPAGTAGTVTVTYNNQAGTTEIVASVTVDASGRPTARTDTTFN